MVRMKGDRPPKDVNVRIQEELLCKKLRSLIN